MSYAICLRKSRADAEAEARGEGEISIGHTASLAFCAHYRQFFISSWKYAAFAGNKKKRPLHFLKQPHCRHAFIYCL